MGMLFLVLLNLFLIALTGGAWFAVLLIWALVSIISKKK